jgi:ubiquinone/menaquinone biosynthesis C-methylase UbiE
MTEPEWLAETRTAYDTVARSYATLLEDALDASPLDRGVLATFAELVPPGSRVVDVGCGPGRITAHLAELGLDVHGIDLSPAMVAEARRRHPELDFEVGDLQRLPIGDGVLGGVVAWYSLIHAPPERLPLVLSELHRVLAPGGWLVTAFQVGDERRHIEHGYGHDVSLHAYRRSPTQVEELLTAARFETRTRVVREPEDPETVPQAYLLARRP